MAAPGFSAESALYRSTVHYHTLASPVATEGAGQLAEIRPSADVRPPVIGGPVVGTGTVNPGSGCSVRRPIGGGAVLDYSVQTTFQSKPLVLTISTTYGVVNRDQPRILGRGAATEMQVTLAGADVLRLQVTEQRSSAVGATARAATAQTFAYTYGDAIKGVRNAALTIQNDTATGNVDGREISSTRLSRTTRSIPFQDGRPAPSIVVDPNLTAAIKGLVDRAQPEIRKCQGAASTPVRVPPRQPIVPAYFPGSATEARCNDCSNDCASELVECSALAAVPVLGCIFFPACGAAIAAAAAAQAVCDGASLACLGVCEATKCCPKACGIPDPLNLGQGCCDSGEQCVNESDPNSRDGCCPSGNSVCGGKCCASGEKCCGNSCCAQSAVCCGNSCCSTGQHCGSASASLCCPSGQDACGSACCQTGWCQAGNVCCPPGQPVCNGVCCNGGACDKNGNCCGPTTPLCGGSCCPGFTGCCDGKSCCGLDEECVGGGCCLQSQVCGNVCCPAGHSCEVPSTGNCSTCAPGTVVSTCQTATDADASTQCCPPDVSCCNGQCCPFASDQNGPVVCCNPLGRDVAPFDNDQFGCHHQSACPIIP